MMIDENEDMDMIEKEDIEEEMEENENDQPSFPSLTPNQMNVNDKITKSFL